MRSTVEYFNHLSSRLAKRYEEGKYFQRRLAVWTRYITQYTSPGGLCLDAGCGAGTLSCLALSQGMHLVGVDQSREMIQLAETVCQAYSDKGLFIQCRLPWGDERYKGTVQLVICSSVLEYVEDVMPVVRELYDFLAPGGVLLVSLPNRHSLLRLLESKIGWMVPRVREYLQHQQRQFSLAEGLDLFKNMGFIYQTHEFYGLPSLLYHSPVRETQSRWGTMILLAFRKAGPA